MDCIFCIINSHFNFNCFHTQAEKAQELADAAERAFQKFDTNRDGSVSVTELKAGLEKVLKVRI